MHTYCMSYEKQFGDYDGAPMSRLTTTAPFSFYALKQYETKILWILWGIRRDSDSERIHSNLNNHNEETRQLKGMLRQMTSEPGGDGC